MPIRHKNIEGIENIETLIIMKTDKEFLLTVGDAISNFTKETLPDIAEIAVDSMLEDGILKDIPIINSFLAAGMLFGDIRNAFLTKHVLVFTQQLNNGTILQEKIKQHYEELEKNPKKKLQELEIILQSLSKNKKYIQDKILANFYSAYCNPDVDFNWTDFELMSQITEGLFPYDLVELHKIYRAGDLKSGEFDTYAAMRLSALGLITYDSGALTWASTISNETPNKVTINKIGKIFWKLGMTGIGYHQGEWIL